MKTTFKSSFAEFSKRDLTEQTLGTYLFVILDVDLYIQKVYFMSGYASYGGAIYVSGQSNIRIIDS